MTTMTRRFFTTLAVLVAVAASACIGDSSAKNANPASDSTQATRKDSILADSLRRDSVARVQEVGREAQIDSAGRENIKSALAAVDTLNTTDRVKYGKLLVFAEACQAQDNLKLFAAAKGASDNALLAMRESREHLDKMSKLAAQVTAKKILNVFRQPHEERERAMESMESDLTCLPFNDAIGLMDVVMEGMKDGAYTLSDIGTTETTLRTLLLTNIRQEIAEFRKGATPAPERGESEAHNLARTARRAACDWKFTVVELGLTKEEKPNCGGDRG